MLGALLYATFLQVPFTALCAAFDDRRFLLADIVEAGPFLEAFALLIVLPLALAWATEAWASQRRAGARA